MKKATNKIETRIAAHGWTWNERSQGYVSSDQYRAYDVLRFDADGRATLTINDTYDHYIN